MKRFEIDDTCVPPIYRPLLLDNTRYLVLYGGRGSGKSKFAFRKFILRAFKNEFFRCVYCIKEFSAIRDSIYSGLKEAIDDLGLNDYFKAYDSDYRIKCTNGNIFLPMGVDEGKDKLEKLKGKEEISHLLIDEVNKLTRDEYLTLNELLRTAKTTLQTCVMFNPVMETNWLRSEFFSPEDSHAPNPDYGDDLKILRTTLWNNNFINREQYYADLLRGAAGDKNRIKVNIEGDWGMEENNNPWLYNFDIDRHVADNLPFIPQYPVYVSFDFNNDPFACTVWQMSPTKGGRNDFIHCIKEFSGMIKIEEMCQRIKSTYPNSIIYVTGDRSGQNEDIGRNQTLYQMITSYLGTSEKLMNLNNTNLEHSDSRILMNVMLYNYPHILFSKSGCPNFISQCSAAKVDEESSKPSHLLKNRKDHKNDEFDSGRYFFQTYFHKWAKDTYLKVLNK